MFKFCNQAPKSAVEGSFLWDADRFLSLFQTQGETAPSQLVLYHYPDLQKEKGIVLMTAEMDSKFLVVHDAQCLANQVQLFYATDRSETYGLVETFNHRSSEFKYMSVIAELEQSGLGRELRPGQVSDKS